MFHKPTAPHFTSNSWNTGMFDILLYADTESVAVPKPEYIACWCFDSLRRWDIEQPPCYMLRETDGYSFSTGKDLNSLAFEKYGNNFTNAFLKLILWIDISWALPVKLVLGVCHRTPFVMMIKWTLVQAMAWCRQATSHYLSQCGPDLWSYLASLGHKELIK